MSGEASVSPSGAAPSSPRILVTGASGLLGGALLRRLRAHPGVIRILVRRPAPHFDADPAIDVVYGDLGDADAVDRAVRGVETVYHAGAAMSGDKAAFESGTIRGTANVAAACVRHGIKRLVYVSSIILMDHAGHRPGAPVDESHALEPRPASRGFYTQAKLQAEQAVQDAMRQDGLRAVIIRPGQIVGPGTEKTPPAGVIGFAGRWIVVGDGRLLLPGVYLEDLVDALLLAAAQEGVEGLTFHIVDVVHPVTQNDYIDACRRAARGKLRVSYLPEPVLNGAAMLAGLVARVAKVDLPLSPYRLRSSRPLGPFDVRAARDILKWRPRIGARRGLELSGR